MAKLDEQLKCDCNSEGWSNDWWEYRSSCGGEMPTQARWPEIENGNRILCPTCDAGKWVNPSELNLWHDLRVMNTIW